MDIGESAPGLTALGPMRPTQALYHALTTSVAVLGLASRGVEEGTASWK